MRFSYGALKIAQGQFPVVRFEGKKNDYYKRIRNGDYILEDELCKYRNRVEKINELLKTSDLPEDLDPSVFDEWILSLRKKSIIDQGFMPDQITDDYGDTKIKEIGENILRKYGIDGIIHCGSLVGSHLHINKQTGEKDYIILFSDIRSKIIVRDYPYTLVIDPLKGLVSSKLKSILKLKGIVMVEISHAFRLLLEGDIRITEMISSLMRNCTYFCSGPWMHHFSELIESDFISINSVRKILEYVELETKIRRKKGQELRQYHTVRLLMECKNLLQNNRLELSFSEDYLTTLSTIRNNQSENTDTLIEQLTQEANTLLSQSQLPEQPNEPKLSHLLTQLLSHDLLTHQQQ
eukprot:TRINITY_DN5849_c0_g1_i4.p1 TRINITY_DN5849_c0_g1~~TRINITY_DN5849_c0_g1_i4.p1  ORF type:complete len:350 (+),score=59.57 TRINITY_DN5849_c0_g1_i4:77-1126(+)